MAAIAALASFAVDQLSRSRPVVAGLAFALAGVLFLIYRYLDARFVRDIIDSGDVEAIEPFLKQLARRLKRK